MLAGLGLLGLAWVARSSYRIATHDFEPWPGSAILKHPEEIGVAGLTPVSFVSGGGAKLAAWYVPSKNRAAVVLAHGTNADRSALLPELRILANAGFGVLAFDWPGDGESTGHIEWGQEEQDALRAALGWLTMQHDIDPQRIGGFGFSMGGYTLAQVAAQDPPQRPRIMSTTRAGRCGAGARSAKGRSPCSCASSGRRASKFSHNKPLPGSRRGRC
jgi:uncharacterized protein